MSNYTELRYQAIFVPRLFLDGNQWCALFGENIQTGICGFGITPAEALQDYENAFHKSCPPPKEGE